MTNIHYGILLEMFLDILPPEDKHKSFVVKIRNKATRYHTRHKRQAAASERLVKEALKKSEKVFTDSPVAISIGAICWIIHNKHEEELAGYGFDRIWFAQMNKYYSSKGAVMTSAKVVSVIEGFLDGKA